MRKRFLRPIKFIKKYEDKVISMSLTQKPYKLYLFCDNSYTVIYYKTLPDIRFFYPICYFKVKGFTLYCFFNRSNVLRINKSISKGDFERFVFRGVPVL